MPFPSPERWRAISPYLDRALELSHEQRLAWLASLRAEDTTLAADVEALIEQRSVLSQEGFLAGDPPPRPTHASLAGLAIGAYTLRSLVGQGGMGSVWLAERNDGRFEGRVAVKLLNASLIGHAGEERFRREGQILARLRHPHIAHLIDAGISPLGQPYLVLEHVDGQRIDQYCDAAKLGVEARIRVFLEVLAAVAHAHANLIVHRDLKPSNVLVGTDGQVKLLDFGIAKLLEPEAPSIEATTLTREGGGVLTPDYAAPEQVTGGPVTTATDVYALGVLLYLLLTGRHPAGDERQSPADRLKAIVDTAPQRLSDAANPTRSQTPATVVDNAAKRATTPDRLRRLLRGDLDTIVAKALKKNPQERYSQVGGLADDLKRYLDLQPISARPDTLTYRAAKFARRHARGLAAVGAAVLLLAGLVGFYTARLAAERDRARLQADKASKVSALLTELLTGADPYRTPTETGEPTVRALLDAGAERISKQLAGQPELQAEMLTVVGRVYQRLGARDRAQPLLEEALAIGRRVAGPEHERVAQSLNDLGVLLREKGDYAAAGPMLEQALAMRRRLLGSEHADVAVTLVELGRASSDQGSPERAEPLLREALTIRRKVLGEEHRETATSLSDLAALLRQKGDLAGAELLLRQCLAINRKVLGEDHPNLGATLNDLGLIAGAKGDFSAAEQLFRQALATNRRALGDRPPNVSTNLSNLSRALLEQGKYDEAASVLQEALRIAGPVLGADHPLMGGYLANLARVHLARREPVTAERLLRQALGIHRRVHPENDWRIAVSKSLLGASLTALGRYQEAEPLLVDAQSVLKDIPGPQGREARATLTRLVALYEAWGRPEKATPYRALASQD